MLREEQISKVVTEKRVLGAANKTSRVPFLYKFCVFMTGSMVEVLRVSIIIELVFIHLSALCLKTP